MDATTREEWLPENFESIAEACLYAATMEAYKQAKKFLQEHDDCSWMDAFRETGNAKYFRFYFEVI